MSTQTENLPAQAATSVTRILVDEATGTRRSVSATPEMWEHLEIESTRRNISLGEMYDIEQNALAEISRLGITDEFLNHVMQVAKPPQRDHA